MTGDLWLERVAPGPERELHLALLLLADEPQPLRGYLQSGNLYVLRAGDGSPVGATHVMPYDADSETFELKAVAIVQTRHNQGFGRRMLAMVLDDLRARGAQRVVVGTSNAGIGEIAFYQKAGFRLWRIERDYFTPEKGYDPNDRHNGLPHRDMVWFDQDLTPAGIHVSDLHER